MTNTHDLPAVSLWVERWAHLIAPLGSILDIACGHGRHMQWFAKKGHAVIGIDRSPEAIQTAAEFGETILADIENGSWPLMNGNHVCQFDAVVVTNYLWRPLLQTITQSVAPGGVLIYETFSQGNETVGKPSRADFLLMPLELLRTCANMRVVAFEDGFLENPPRFVQRIAAVRPTLDSQDAHSLTPARYAL